MLSIVVILTLNPVQLFRQSRDSTRLSDLANLNTTLGIFSEDVANGSLGTVSTLYVSIPDATATSTAGDQCQGLGLPTLPSTWAYHCASLSAYRNVDGTGWIPANFTSISSRSPIHALPVDPTNDLSSRLYYTYVTDGKTFEVTAPMESQKYKAGGSNDVISGDGGPLASVYEKGTKLGLEPMDYGDSSLVGYWPLDEGAGSVAYDYSGSNATGSWAGTLGSQWTTGKVGPYAGNFNGTDNYVNLGNVLNMGTNSFSITHWFKLSGTNDSGSVCKGLVFNLNNPGYCIRFLVGGTSIEAYIGGSGTGAGSIATYTWNDSAWHFIAWVIDRLAGVSRLYIDGNVIDSGTSITSQGNLDIASNLTLGSDSGAEWFINGSLDDVRIYNRALSATEIRAMYNGGK